MTKRFEKTLDIDKGYFQSEAKKDMKNSPDTTGVEGDEVLSTSSVNDFVSSVT